MDRIALPWKVTIALSSVSAVALFTYLNQEERKLTGQSAAAVSFQLAGTPENLERVLDMWTRAKDWRGFDAVVRLIYVDFALILAYAAFLVSFGWLGFRRDFMRFGAIAAVAGVLAGVCDVVENLISLELLHTAQRQGMSALGAHAFAIHTMAILASVKFALVIAALCYELGCLCVSYTTVRALFVARYAENLHEE